MANVGYKKLEDEITGPQEKAEKYCCQICVDNHLRVAAQCQTCQKYLCEKCLENHEKNLEFANHLITNNKQTQKNDPVSKKKSFSSDEYINIKVSGDKNTCSATGLAFLTADVLAVADKANKCVKLVDVNKAEIISKMRLSSGPRDLAVLPPELLAVTLKDEEVIQIISTKPELSTACQIRTNGKCRGIAYSQDRFVVTFASVLFSKIQVLSRKGDILNTFDFTEKGDYLVYDPRAIGISPDENHIYVTDFLKSSLFRLSWTGKVTAMYKDLGEVSDLVITDNGSLYTCSRDRNSVRHFAADMSESKIVLDVNDGLRGPLAMAYSVSLHRLYISYRKGRDEGRNYVQVFKII